jgi:hypothetical protein
MAKNIHTVVKVQEEEPTTYSGAIWLDTDDETVLPSNADTVDNFHASQTPTADYILPLNNNGAIDVKDTYIENTTEDEDILIKINDGGTVRNAIQIHGDEGSVSFPRQSYVYATGTNDQALATSSQTTIIFNNEITDTLSEYNPATGVFTATISGVYSISATVGIKHVNSGSGYGIYIYKDTSALASTFETAPASTTPYSRSITMSVYLSAGESTKINVYHNAGHTEYTNGTTSPILNVFTVTKVS